MKGSKLIEVIQDGHITIPIYFLKNYKKFKLDMEEFVFLMYLYNKNNRFMLNPQAFCDDLNMDLSEVMELIDKLTEKGFIEIEVSKNDKGFMEEYIILDGFYNKIKLFMIDNINKEKSDEVDNSSIYEMIEKEFGRTLSSMEYEIIKAWLDSNFSEEIIKEALREAVLSNVFNLKYIDKILYEWNKKGIKTVQDVEKNRKKRNASLEKQKDDTGDIDLGLMDWAWFDEDE